jgi:hypothetical protein
VARTLRPRGWRMLMPDIRQVALGMAQEGLVEITQKNRVLPTDAQPRGPIRIRQARSQ